MSAAPQQTDPPGQRRRGSFVPTAEAMALLDRIVRECKQVGRHVDAKRLRSLSPTIRARTKKHRGFSAMLG